MSDLATELKRYIEGEVRFDEYSRILYSTDASIYQIEPIGVVIPKHKDDVIVTIKTANERGIPVLPRGAGTGLAGGAVGKAVILDMTKYMNQILEINTEEQWVRVQPGVILDELNAYLKGYGFLFGPDVATSNRASIGGMIGNNSSGARSLIYGKTVDNVLEVTVILSNGEEAVFKPLSEDELNAKIQNDGLERQIYQEVRRIVAENREEILQRYPKIMRRVAGYNLDEFIVTRENEKIWQKGQDGKMARWQVPSSPLAPLPPCPPQFNLAKLIVGSEGTLATVLEAKVKIAPRPKMTAVDVIHFDNFIQSMEATNEALQCGPSAVEVVDKTVLDLTKESIQYSRLRTFLQGEPEAILIVEFYGDSQEELLEKIDNLEKRFKAKGYGYAFVRALSAEDISKVWRVRKAGLALLMGMKGDAKPTGFVEDTAVSPEKLPEYIRRFKQIIDDHGTTAAYYAHASVGCLHIRPILNLKKGSEVEKLRSISEKIADLVLEFDGAISAEHGDGLARSCFVEKAFGPKLYKAFQEVKQVFDPKGIMNPGKIVHALPMDENLRYGEGYQTIPYPSRESEAGQTYFDFSADGGFAGAIEMCSGVGVCRKTLEGTMCPSFMYTREEEHSTRGRANALRAALCGDLPKEELTGKRLYDVLDLCLGCKSCKSECPSNVDMAKIKYEFLAHYYKENGLPLRNWLFGNIETLNWLGCEFVPLSNWVMRRRIVKWAFDRFVGIDKRRQFPHFAPQTFERWLKQRKKGKSNAPAEPPKKVVLFHDTYMNYNDPQIGIATTKILEAAGYEIILPDKKCCGKPMISKGMLEKAIKNAQYNVEHLAVYAEQGYPIVGCEPSCMLTIRDDYPDLIDDERAELVAKNTYTIEEFLVRLHENGELNPPFFPPLEKGGGGDFKGNRKKILLHGHCYQKALIGTAALIKLLKLPGYDVEEIDSGCCGMAGAFGYEKEHYEISMGIGAMRLFKAINSQNPPLPPFSKGGQGEFEVVASGTSCRQQIADGTGKRAKHPVEVLAEAL
ncbi:anaerobic glycerol-3-phosphate dehydrogenase subunit C [Candidatus Poribacteria bacterium]|nr:anaerobic glycerol-3-phosphate dehydrogenase subunit C [Candidatus Poribacteria bacterium]